MAVSVVGAMGFGDITQVSEEPPLKDLMIETSARGPLGGPLNLVYVLGKLHGQK